MFSQVSVCPQGGILYLPQTYPPHLPKSGSTYPIGMHSCVDYIYSEKMLKANIVSSFTWLNVATHAHPLLAIHTRILDFKFRLLHTSVCIFIFQPCVRVFLLRIFVECFHVGVCRRRIQVIIQFFAILPMISL